MMDIIDRPNHEKVNYSLRPAKHVERKMLCDAFSKLSVIDKLETYQYIGFGSAYFSDFSLIHRTLGISELTSIERDEESEYRFKFNIPYSCIDLKIGSSGDILPYINWSKKSITWLDYTEKLKNYMINDIQTCVMSLIAGSVFLLSVNIEPDSGELNKNEREEGITIGTKRLKMLSDRIDSRFIPNSAQTSSLGLLDNQKITHEIIDTAIKSTLSRRNAVLKDEFKLNYSQIFNFYYKDKVGMLTVGGIFYDESQNDKIIKMSFENLEYVRSGNLPFKIGNYIAVGTKKYFVKK